MMYVRYFTQPLQQIAQGMQSLQSAAAASERVFAFLESAGSVELSQGAGGHKVSFPKAMSAGDDVALLATSRECTKNGDIFAKKGFYQYSAAWDSKHNVTLEDGKSARVLYTIQQMQDGVKR